MSKAFSLIYCGLSLRWRRKTLPAGGDAIRQRKKSANKKNPGDLGPLGPYLLLLFSPLPHVAFSQTQTSDPFCRRLRFCRTPTDVTYAGTKRRIFSPLSVLLLKRESLFCVRTYVYLSSSSSLSDLPSSSSSSSTGERRNSSNFKTRSHTREEGRRRNLLLLLLLPSFSFFFPSSYSRERERGRDCLTRSSSSSSSCHLHNASRSQTPRKEP